MPSGNKQQSDRQKEFKAGNSIQAIGYLSECWERLWPLMVPFFLLVCAFISLSWLGLWQHLPTTIRYFIFAVFVLITIIALRPLRSFALPTKREILKRIEKHSKLQHRPVTAQTDKVAKLNSDNQFSDVLWKEHKQRMARQLDNLASGAPKPDANRYDRWALRAVLPLIVFIAFGFSYSQQGGRVSDIWAPRVNVQNILSRLDAWVRSPLYTGKPHIYLNETVANSTNGPSTVVSGAELYLRYVGKHDVRAQFRIGEKVSKTFEPQKRFEDSDKPETSFSDNLTTSGTVEFFAENKLIAEWPIIVEADEPPTIKFDQPIGKSVSGALEFNYALKDDYGVSSARGIIKLAEIQQKNARPLVGPPELILPLPKARVRSGKTKVNRDLTSHPWAGADVAITLEAKDESGQTGLSKPEFIKLPIRNFFDPLAKALVEQRRILSLDANQALYVANLLEAVISYPDKFKIDSGVYITLNAAYRMIVSHENDEELRRATDILWESALALEDGDLSEVERRLREAQEKLSKALEDGASEEDIDNLFKELRQAMNEYLREMAKEMARNPLQKTPLGSMQNSQTITQRDLEKMMKRIEDLAKSGSEDAARELLAEMQRLMDNMRAGLHQQQRRSEGNQLNKKLDELSELMQQQQMLMDETFSMQNKNSPGSQEKKQGGQEGGQMGQSEEGQNKDPSMSQEEFEEALRDLKKQQEDLQKQLGELGEQLEEFGFDPSSEFAEAGENMGQAGESLGQGKTGKALGEQGNALEALRRGAQSMMQQMAGDRNQGGQQSGEAGNSGNRESLADPLGRFPGRMGSEDTKVPGEFDAQRAREIMDAIRKKLSDPLRPLLERNYLERLLNSR